MARPNACVPAGVPAGAVALRGTGMVLGRLMSKVLGRNTKVSSLRKRAVVLAVSALVIGGLAGCGSGSDSTSSSGQSGDALTELLNNVKVSLQKAVDTTDSAKSVSFTMSGTIGGETQQGEGSIVLSDPPRVQMTVSDPSGEKQVVRMIGAVAYTEIPAEEQADMDGKKWLKMDLSTLGAGKSFSSFEDVDPVSQVKKMLAGDDVTAVGKETVDGVETVHYTTTVPLDKHLEQIDAELREGVRKSLSEAGVETLTTDVWVDEQYRPRQVRVQMGPAGDLTVNYREYDKDITVEEPPADETADFKDILGDLSDLQTELGQ